MSNSGFKFAQVPETAEQKQEKEASEFAKMIEADTKSIVEQQNKYFMAAGFKAWTIHRGTLWCFSGVRRRGPSKLDTTNLVAGSFLPSFTPIAADLMKKTAQVAIRVEVYEKFTTGTNTRLKIKKNSLAYVGMHLGDGSQDVTCLKWAISWNLSYFSLQSKNHGHRGTQSGTQVRCRSTAGRCSPLRSSYLPDCQAVGGAGRPLCWPVCLWFYKMLKINKLTKWLYLGKSYHWILGKVSLVTHQISSTNLSNFQY